jgi:hypothetical protein
VVAEEQLMMKALTILSCWWACQLLKGIICHIKVPYICNLKERIAED